ncbi:MAG TPA: ATP-binding protein, partial [Gemmatimonadaceae bacterium]|nr:ATP-binding protein [Gemmatimonadaceae bacterium]
LSASGWLATPRVGYLAACLLATAVGLAGTLRFTPRSLRPALLVSGAALLTFALMATRAQQRLARFSAAPAVVGAEQSADQRALLASRVDAELATLRDAAVRARRFVGTPDELSRRLARIIGDNVRRSALVVHADTLLGWAGTLHANPRALVGPSGVVTTPFGLTLYAASDSAGRRAVATSLLHVSPPPDRLVRGIAQRLPGSEVTEGFVFSAPDDSAGADALRYTDGGRPLFVARALVPSADEVRFRMRERARVRVGVALLVALVALLVAASRREAGALATAGVVLVALRCIAVVPLSAFSTRSRLFDASVYYLAGGGSFTSNAAALTLTSATALLAALLVVRRARRGPPRAVGAAIGIVGTLLGPYFVRTLSRGIHPPADGAGVALWLIWEIPLCLAATTLLVIAAWGGRAALVGRRSVDPAAGPALAMLAAIVAPLVWMAPGQWPEWYALLWVAAIGALVATRRRRNWLLSAASVAALAATTVVWGSTSRGRVELAERDVRGLAGPDSAASALTDRLALRLQGDTLPRTAQALLQRYVTSDLAASGYPVALSSWEGEQPIATFGSAPFNVAWDTVRFAALEAQKGSAVESDFKAGPYGVRVVAVPMRGGALTILVAPRTRLIGSDAYSRWYGLSPGEANEPPYDVQVVGDPLEPRESIRWRRSGTELHGDWPVQGPEGAARAHVEVDLRGLDSLIPRGGLLLLIDLAAVALVWLLAATADGRVGRWVRMRRRRVRSYRTRLSLALFLFFLVPAAAFAVWSWQQLYNDAQQSRRLLVSETIRAVAGDRRQPDWLRRESMRLDTKLLFYNAGVLVDASDSLFAELAPLGALLRPDVYRVLVTDEVSATRSEPLAGATGMMGYRVMPGSRGSIVLAAPARVDDVQLDRRRRDLGVLVLFATAVGAVAALWLSALAARQLARPIGALRTAARAVARGERELPFEGEPTSEFLPVFRAFEAMAEDLGASRAALEEAQRRTDAVLRTVASGVVAVDEQGRVILANPRAETLLGDVPRAGEPVSRMPTAAVAARLAGFLRSEALEDAFDMERDGRSLRGQLSRLSSGGAVLTLDDVTELAHAQRVLAWGEMARQVAHEIKNPLTPIRLGVQHLRRARGRADFDHVLDQNVTRILNEIDRLDEIARSFSRYGGAPEERPPAEPTDVAAIVRDVVTLETLGEGTVDWRCRVEGEPSLALGRGDELREVLLNLFENARLAKATVVTATVCDDRLDDSAPAVQIAVADDGIGIAEEVLPRIFEPHFSTRTSGSGLGLAITRRLVEGWGGTVTIESKLGKGTTVRVRLRAAAPPFGG